MKSTFARSGLMAVLIALLAGCGGGGGGGGTSAPATNPLAGGSSEVAVNPQAPWVALAAVDPAVPPVAINSPPDVSFAVLDASGKHVPGLKLLNGDAACNGNNVRMTIAKFDGSNWQSLISRQRYDAGNAPAGKFAVVEATTDPLPTATITNPATALADWTTRVVGILEENAKGYYTYHFATDVRTPLKLADAVAGKNVALGRLANNEQVVALDGATVHRVGIQLCFVDPQTKETVKVNPYLDFTVAADRTVALVNTANYRKVVDKASCNECHQSLAAHGGGRVDPNYCVTCHNPGSTDSATNNSIDLKLMLHRFHMGKKLTQDYQIQSFVAKKTDPVTLAVTGVDYPQDQRNCVKCHDGSATAVNKTANGNNWMTHPSRNACLGCHDDITTWQQKHDILFNVAGIPVEDRTKDSTCKNCHADTAPPSFTVAALHAVPEWTFGANYQYNIHAVTWNADRTVSVEFSVSNPTDGTVYNIQDPQYQYTTVNTAGTTTTKNFVFGRLSLLFGWGSGDFTNVGAVARGWGSSCTVAPTASPTCDAVTGLPKPSSGAGSLITRGQPVSISATFDSVPVAGTNNHFKVTSTVVPTTASGTGVVALQGRIGLKKDANSSYSVPVKNAVSYFAVGGSGTVAPRRTVVTADKCNSCHGRNINAHGHGGNRTEPEVCVVCHNGNNVLNGTTVAGGAVTVAPESADFKRMIHALHKAQGANYPVMPSSLNAASGNYSGLKNCNACHVNDSYKKDLGVMGSSTVLQVDLTTASANATITDTDPSNNPVISPKAAVCSSCHVDDKATDATIKAASDTAKSHMIDVGGAVFGTATQADLAAGRVLESCDSCHASGGLAAVDSKHGLK